ncbi:MAG: Fe-S cluster assembly scaffold protein NifU [Clostridia bacterium]|nr:Fe-S cluster assembly scaffold protein NifU [Clostridia bacterium]
MQYSSKVMEHLMNPRNVGELENANAVGMVGNAKCGDIMQMFMVIDDNEVIQEVTFKTFGCGAAIATSSMATELVKGKTIKEALALTNTAVMEALDGLPPVKVHCSVLAEEAIRAALADYYTRKGIDPTPIVGEIKPFGEDDDDHHHDIPEEE